MADLTTRYLGLSLRNPIIVGSSGLTDSVDNLVELEKAGAGAVVIKSLFEEQILHEAEASMKKAYEDDMIYSAKAEALDYIDVHIREESLSQYINTIRQAKQKLVIPVIASINCISPVEWTTFAGKIEQAGADAIELNIAILVSDPVKTSEEVENTYIQIIKKVMDNVSIPVSVKISPFFSNLRGMVKKLATTGIKGIVMFNRFYSPDFDINNLTEKSTGTLSSPAEMSNVLRWVALTSEDAGCDIAATTGIHDGHGAVKQMLAGAAAVQIVSVLYKKGIDYLQEMLTDVEKWMDEKGYNSIQQFRGKMGGSEGENPEAFTRIQFMKYFSEIR